MNGMLVQRPAAAIRLHPARLGSPAHRVDPADRRADRRPRVGHRADQARRHRRPGRHRDIVAPRATTFTARPSPSRPARRRSQAVAPAVRLHAGQGRHGRRRQRRSRSTPRSRRSTRPSRRRSTEAARKALLKNAIPDLLGRVQATLLAMTADRWPAVRDEARRAARPARAIRAPRQRPATAPGPTWPASSWAASRPRSAQLVGRARLAVLDRELVVQRGPHDHRPAAGRRRRSRRSL